MSEVVNAIDISKRFRGAVVRGAQSGDGRRAIQGARGRAGAADRGEAAQDAVINTRAARGAPPLAERVRRLTSRQMRVGRGAAVPLN